MELTIIEPRWTKPALVLAGGSFRVLCENASDAPVARLVERGLDVALTARGGTASPEGEHASFDCTAPDDAPEGLYDLNVAGGGREATIHNSVRVLGGFRDRFTFLHTSDLHLIGKLPDGRVGDRSAVAEKLVDAINSLRPEFVINTGDLISRYGKDARDVLPRDSVEWQVRRAREILLGLEVPMFLTPGNHDLAFEWCRAPWAEHMGGSESDDYSFDYGEYHFVSLDGRAEYDERTLEPTRMGFSDGQLSWLADDMKRAAGSRLRFLFSHYDYKRQLGGLLDELRVDMVMYGHSKPIPYERADGANFVNGHLPGTRAYQLVTVDGDSVSVEAGPLYHELAGERAG